MGALAHISAMVTMAACNLRRVYPAGTTGSQVPGPRIWARCAATPTQAAGDLGSMRRYPSYPMASRP